jgi:hypothetical protein
MLQFLHGANTPQYFNDRHVERPEMDHAAPKNKDFNDLTFKVLMAIPE